LDGTAKTFRHDDEEEGGERVALPDTSGRGEGSGGDVFDQNGKEG
jgi:hypothetical protein